MHEKYISFYYNINHTSIKLKIIGVYKLLVRYELLIFYVVLN